MSIISGEFLCLYVILRETSGGQFSPHNTFFLVQEQKMIYCATAMKRKRICPT